MFNGPKRFTIASLAGISLLVAVALDNPDSAKAKVAAGGEIITSVADSGGQALRGTAGAIGFTGTPLSPASTVPTKCQGAGCP